MALVTYDDMNAREQLEACANWLSYQLEDMSYGLKSPEDGLNLWRHMKANDDLPELADEWDAADRIKAIGYCPFQNCNANTLVKTA